MSNKNKNNKNQASMNEVKDAVVNEEVKTESVNEGVTLVEGDNSIDETEVKEEIVVNETSTNNKEVSVADVQESVIEEEKEDNTATINKEVTEKEDAVVNEDTDVEVTPSKDGFYVTLGNVPKERVELSKERITKAGYKATILDDGEIVVGPYADEATVIAVRKKIVSKGLKGRIIKR